MTTATPTPEPARSRCEMLALVTDAFGGYGGIAQYNRDFLSAAALDPGLGSVLALPRLAPDTIGPLPASVKQLPAIQNKIAYSLRAAAAALGQRPRMVFNGHLYHGPLAQRLARNSRARLVSQLHGTEVWEDIPPAALQALEASDLILTVSRDTRARVLNRIRMAPQKVAVLNNTVGEDFRPGDRNAARARWGLGRDLIVLTVARLDPRAGYKGHDRIIPLIAQLRSQGMPVTYLIVGEGADLERLARLARDCNVGDHVRFLGKVPMETLPDVYRAADLFALPSTGEGFGIAYLEAMACGTPAIGLAVGGVPDALGDGELGACVAPEDFPRAFVEALEHCREAHDHLPGKVRERFGFQVFASRLQLLLRRLLS